MTGFLHNLIATARQRRPVLRPRPVSLFEGLSPADPATDSNDEVLPAPNRITPNADNLMSHPAPVPGIQDSAALSPPTKTPAHLPSAAEEMPAAPPEPAAATQHTITKIIREVQKVAPAPALQPAPMPMPNLQAGVREATVRDNSAQPATPQPRKATSPPATPQITLPRDSDAPPPASTRLEKSIVHHERTVEHHHRSERVQLEKDSTPREAPIEHKPQSRTVKPKSTTAPPVAPLPQRFMPARNPLQSAKAETQQTVNVSIGSVEIRAVSTPRSPISQARITPPQPMSLDDYLQQRNRGGVE